MEGTTGDDTYDPRTRPKPVSSAIADVSLDPTGVLRNWRALWWRGGGRTVGESLVTSKGRYHDIEERRILNFMLMTRRHNRGMAVTRR